MATADELLRDDIIQPDPEGHIVIAGDRRIFIPDNLKRLGVQYDHNIETVIFDCPRYWDNHDMSEMVVYIIYTRSDGHTGRYPARNITADGDIMHFEWTISRDVTGVSGELSFLVSTEQTADGGIEEHRWSSELTHDAYISPGMNAGDEDFIHENEDLLTSVLQRMNSIDQTMNNDILPSIELAERLDSTIQDGLIPRVEAAEEAVKTVTKPSATVNCNILVVE